MARHGAGTGNMTATDEATSANDLSDIFFWGKTTTTNETWTNKTSDPHYLFISGINRQNSFMNNTGHDFVVVVNDGVWNALQWEYDGTVEQFYKNNSAGTNNTETRPASSGTLFLFSNRLQNERLVGDMAHFVIWNDINISANERGGLSRGVHPFPIQHEHQAINLPLHGLDDPEPDESPAQVTGTIVATMTKADTNPPVELLENYL